MLSPCYLSHVYLFKHSDTKWDKKINIVDQILGGGGGAPVEPPLYPPLADTFHNYCDCLVSPDFNGAKRWKSVYWFHSCGIFKMIWWLCPSKKCNFACFHLSIGHATPVTSHLIATMCWIDVTILKVAVCYDDVTFWSIIYRWITMGIFFWVHLWGYIGLFQL